MVFSFLFFQKEEFVSCLVLVGFVITFLTKSGVSGKDYDDRSAYEETPDIHDVYSTTFSFFFCRFFFSFFLL